MSTKQSGKMTVAEYKKQKPSKYRNKPVELSGIRFASQREAARYKELRLLERTKDIALLRLQVRHPLRVNGQLICTYVSDFEYYGDGTGLVVEDVKGVKTPVYKLKKKLMRAVYGIEIREV